MNLLLIGNALCLIGSVIMTLMGFIKKKNRFLLAQSGMNVFFITGNLCLGGISGAVANTVTLVRNLVCLRRPMTTGLKLLFIGLQIALTAAFGSTGFIPWLPVLANCLFTWFMDSEDMVLLKIIVILTQLMWAVYDFSIANYATLPFDVATAVTNIAGILAILKERRA